MSKCIRVRVAGVGTITLAAPTAVAERLGADEVLEATRVTARRGGIDVLADGLTLTYTPSSAGGLAWGSFFDQLTAQMLGNGAASMQLSLGGVLIDGVQRLWHVERLKARVARGRGRPRRLDAWDEDREELYARILERRQQHGESLRDAIWSAATLDRKRFGRAFGGTRDSAKALRAAERYCERHAKDGD